MLPASFHLYYYLQTRLDPPIRLLLGGEGVVDGEDNLQQHASNQILVSGVLGLKTRQLLLGFGGNTPDTSNESLRLHVQKVKEMRLCPAFARRPIASRLFSSAPRLQCEDGQETHLRVRSPQLAFPHRLVLLNLPLRLGSSLLQSGFALCREKKMAS
jgi:hypothetical protein